MTETARRTGPGRIIKGIFALQLAMAGLLFAGDIAPSLAGFAPGPRAPEIDQPVRPGDQTRRFRPGSLPERRTPGPFPSLVEMPDRLRLSREPLGDTAVLRLTGRIAPGDGARLAAQIDAVEDTQTLYLHSPGGSVSDALELGRAIRARGLATAVADGDACLSACPYILAGGAARRVAPDGIVGVHQHSFGENTMLPAFLAVEDIQRGQGEVMDFLEEMGIDPLMMRPALLTPPDEIYILLPQELEELGLTTTPLT